MRHLIFALAVILTFYSYKALAQGGPPMVTDDPGTPGDGHWEINIASLFNSTSSSDLIYVPYFDVNYGWGDRIQLKAETGYGWLSQSGDHTSGLDDLLVGVKWRFFDEDKNGIAVSTYPQYQFPLYASHDEDIADGSNYFFLPIEFSKTFGEWQINPEVGYLFSTRDQTAVVYGVVVAYEKLKPWELLAELHETTLVNGDGTQSLVNFGFRYTMCKTANLIAASGYTFTHAQNEENVWQSYLGVQLEL